MKYNRTDNRQMYENRMNRLYSEFIFNCFTIYSSNYNIF